MGGVRTSRTLCFFSTVARFAEQRKGSSRPVINDTAAMLIRRERPEDVAVVDAVTRAAFGRELEPSLLARLREDEGWLPKLSLVAVEAGELVGHVVCTRGFVNDARAVGLGPISVPPDRQRHGVGHALMHAVLGAAEATDEPLVALLGDPAFYHRFGFVNASEAGIASPDPAWGEHFQVRTLAARITGTFRYATLFTDL
jgi:putative acetyltransferase